VEALAAAGFEKLMYAYPVAGKASIRRCIRAARQCELTLRIDGLDAARELDAAAGEAGLRLGYTIIIDAGLHRLGIPPEEAGRFVRELMQFKNLVFRGVSTHPGHVYAAGSARELPRYCEDERRAVKTAVRSLQEAGFAPDIVSSGSTPTFRGTVGDKLLNLYHPGNYIFMDAIQLSTGTAREEDCALTILASVISHPREDLFLCDAGAKCLGLDQGAHGNSSIRGYGVVIGHPEITVAGLSEEVGKLHVEGKTDLKVGDRIRIIPNHACSSANLTSYYVGHRGDEIDHLIAVDVRGNGTKKNVE
jgi:D-serine deaminase-like pyridoxal phosphate-dependent protein